MKQSGINYFYGQQGLDTGTFKVYYTFEEGAGTTVNSVSGGQSLYTGTLSSSTNFWTKPGSGFANGNGLSVANASGLASPQWTMVFGFEKVNANPAVLFRSLSGQSGFNIGLTACNKPYFETFNGTDALVASSSNNYSSKNVITLSYFSNYLNMGYYNFTSQTLEQESISAPFNLTGSDAWTLFPQFTGYMDFFMYFTEYYDGAVLNKLFSGLYAYPTGTLYQTQTISFTGITGNQTITLIQTGITGYIVTANVGDGYSDYPYVFPTAVTTGYLTGIVSSTTYSSGVSGVSSFIVTGGSTVLFTLLTGYAASFGMQKVQLYDFIDQPDILKASFSTTPFDNTYNKTTSRSTFSYGLNGNYDTGQIDLFWNGLAQSTSGWSLLNQFITLSGTVASDLLFFDVKSGDKRLLTVTGALSTFPILYSGQEIYLNGVNLVSGYDFTAAGATITLIGNNTGVSGYLFDYPVVLPSTTGNYSMKTGALFDRNSTNLYRNGVRQQLKIQCIEGGIYDSFSGNFYSATINSGIYINTDDFWEIQ